MGETREVKMEHLRFFILLNFLINSINLFYTQIVHAQDAPNNKKIDLYSVIGPSIIALPLPFGAGFRGVKQRCPAWYGLLNIDNGVQFSFYTFGMGRALSYEMMNSNTHQIELSNNVCKLQISIERSVRTSGVWSASTAIDAKLSFENSLRDIGRPAITESTLEDSAPTVRVIRFDFAPNPVDCGRFIGHYEATPLGYAIFTTLSSIEMSIGTRQSQEETVRGLIFKRPECITVLKVRRLERSANEWKSLKSLQTRKTFP